MPSSVVTNRRLTLLRLLRLRSQKISFLEPQTAVGTGTIDLPVVVRCGT